VDLRPQDFWSNFYLGFASFRLGRFDEAVAAFRVCIALAPDSAECYVNRGLSHEGLGQNHQAIRDYSRALRLNPTLTEAALRRGVLYHQGGRNAEAAADLALALASAPSREVRGVIHYSLARIDLDRGDRPAALAQLQAAADCNHPEARALLGRLRP
jgi:tetratricopeptide (TPR) repeat protein